jgi:hypothetical protein
MGAGAGQVMGGAVAALIVYAAEATALSVNSEATAIALTVSLEDTVMEPE